MIPDVTLDPTLLVATEGAVFLVDPGEGAMRRCAGPGRGRDAHRPTCLAADPGNPARAWCGTRDAGVWRSEDGGRSWQPSGLQERHVTALLASPSGASDPSAEPELWVGTEPSGLWHSRDGGGAWKRIRGFENLPSSSDWAFPPRPETHHVRWIARHPEHSGHLWIAIEAGALITTPDGGRSWKDRTPGGPRDTHELSIHADRPDTLRVAAGDGYFESADGGASWKRPEEGLEVGYLRSVAISPVDPGVVVVSAAPTARAAYVAGRSAGRVFRREGDGAWERVRSGWPDPPLTVAPLLVADRRGGELWAADERGVHRSADGGRSWERVAAFPETPSHLRGLVVQGGVSRSLGARRGH
jgi:photosystem II stability/assembly factor-like uncharacterized protein